MFIRDNPKITIFDFALLILGFKNEVDFAFPGSENKKKLDLVNLVNQE